LLTWYVIALAAVTAVFAALLAFHVRRSVLAEVDARLGKQLNALSAAVQPESERSFYVELSPEQVEYFGQEGPDAPYYAIWDRAGRLVDQSDPARTIPAPAATGTRQRGNVRESAGSGPLGSLVLVGEGVEEERARLNRLLTVIAATGLVVLVGTVGAGWFLTGRALAPIERISQSAANVSASNLSTRIDTEAMETELGELASTINATFDRLQRAFDQQTRFTADASHELRTPLSVVLAQSDLALKKDRTVDEYKQTLDTVRRSARRMKSIVEGLLILARSDAAEFVLDKAPADLAQVVQESCQLLAPLAAERGIRLTTQLESVTVQLDRERFAEVVANLISNAVRYNRDQGQVDVNVSRRADAAVLQIADTGIGISSTDLPHIFERFFRADKARSSSLGGSGLGLAIAKSIVEAHGGTIEAASQMGVGTTFLVTIPAA
jgi:heavy metal sensor kinase